jgi:SnoaL-like domain
MATERQSAVHTSLAYYEAWTSHDFERAMQFIADDIVCDAPSGRLEGARAFRGFMGPFVEIVTRSSLVAAFGDEETALLLYDTDTMPVKDAPGAEFHTVQGGKIRHLRIIFDRLPFELARREAAARSAQRDGGPTG